MKKFPPLFFLFLASFLALFFHFSFLDPLEWREYDFFLRHSQPASMNPNILLVNIDSNSINSQWPWPYRPKIYSEFLDRVEQGKPKLVYFDVLLQAAPQISNAEFQALTTKMKHFRNVVIPLNLSKDGNLLPLSPELIKSAEGFGIPIVTLDPDGEVRRVPLFFKNNQNIFPIPTIPLLLAGGENGYLNYAKPAFNPKDKKFDWYLSNQKIFASNLSANESLAKLFPFWDPVRHRVGWQNLTIPTASNNPDMFVFFKTSFKKAVIPFWKIMKGNISPLKFQNKIIILYNSTEISDSYYTPLSKNFNLQEKTPGGMILAYALNTILNQTFIIPKPTLEKGLSILFLLFFLFLVLYFRAIKGAVLSLLLFWLYLFSAYYLFIQMRIWIGWTHLFFSSLIFLVGALILERMRIFQLISYFVPNKMVEKLEKSGIKLGGEEVYGTAMFVDLQGYTTLAEKVSLKEAYDALKEFHQEIERLAKPYGGIICDWQGDGVLIFFSNHPSTPCPVPFPEKNAVEASLQMKKRFLEKNIKTGIGIASGRVLWGFLGTSSKLQPTVIGDPVNLASRLQGVGKRFGTIIAVDEGTFLAVKASFEWEEQGLQMIRGKTEPVMIYTPVQAKTL